MTQLHPYDEEGKERVRHIADYVEGFTDDMVFPLDELERQKVHELLLSAVKTDDYLMDEYGYDKAEQMVYNRLEQIA